MGIGLEGISARNGNPALRIAETTTEWFRTRALFDLPNRAGELTTGIWFCT